MFGLSKNSAHLNHVGCGRLRTRFRMGMPVADVVKSLGEILLYFNLLGTSIRLKRKSETATADNSSKFNENSLIFKSGKKLATYFPMPPAPLTMFIKESEARR